MSKSLSPLNIGFSAAELEEVSEENNIGFFTPSIYSGLKSATTTVTGQSEAKATGASKLEASHNNVTNQLIIGLGMSTAEAETACSSGLAGEDKFLLKQAPSVDLPIRAVISLKKYTHYAWLGVTGTVSAGISQGV